MTVLAIAATACTKKPIESNLTPAPEITAFQETESGTKTLVEVNDGVGTIYWKPAEKINVFYGTTSTEYISKNKENATIAAFKTNDIIGATEEAATNIWGLYPYDEDAVCNGSKVTTTIASTQYGVPETFDDNLFTTLAHSETRELRFYNVCGGIKFSLSRADITKITFKGNNNETLAGKVDLTFSSDVPVATPVTAEKIITITPKTGSTFSKDVNYYIVTLPASMTGGFTMTFETETKIGTFNYTEKAVTVTRSKFGKKADIDTYATFVDKPESNPEYVDLGLSVQWRAWNIGASKPEEYGRYFAWGDVVGQTWDGSKWSGNGFSTNPSYELDSKGNLKPEYDAGHIILGNSWRMPTKAEQDELIDNCTCTWTSNYNNTGVAGRIFTSKKDGYTDKYIFLPAAGYGDEDEFNANGYSGYYWSSTFEDGNDAWVLNVSSSEVSTSDDERYYGQSIRCVTDEPFVPTIITDLSNNGSANCYIVSGCGTYKFKTVRGRSSTTVGDVKGVKVLWETFGTNVAPSVGDLIKGDISYSDNYITFQTNDTYKEGNALIAAYSDANCTDGNVLWSWHIWLTDQPEEQVYNNNAGTMMDRNLGATSATPGDVHALGLLYQWGRKDPFLSGKSTGSLNLPAESTLSWPTPVETNAQNGTIEYAISHPTTYIKHKYPVYDWLFNSDVSLWNLNYTLYDPCPNGWRVPWGGESGIWAKALGNNAYVLDKNYTYRGVNFGKSSLNSYYQLGIAANIWYPWSGYINDSLYWIGDTGLYWSRQTSTEDSYCFEIDYGSGSPGNREKHRYYANSVRCQKIESK